MISPNITALGSSVMRYFVKRASFHAKEELNTRQRQWITRINQIIALQMQVDKAGGVIATFFAKRCNKLTFLEASDLFR